jgi:hypothetical protein
MDMRGEGSSCTGREKWQAIVNKIMNLLVPLNAENYSIS